MDIKEFSNEFDVLYNNIMSNQAPGLDEYEKSVFLTKAQNELIKNYFTSTQGGNKYQEGFDDSKKRQIDFSTLIVNRACPLRVPSDYYDSSIIEGLTFTGNLYGTAPEALIFGDTSFIKSILLVVSERILVRNVKDGLSDKFYQVIPIKLVELQRILSKPYGRPLKRQAWRILETFNEEESDDSLVDSNGNGFRFILHDEDKPYLIPDGGEIETQEDVGVIYYVTYLRKPKPIILTDLVGLTIDGESIASTSELNSELHPEILQRAVELAKSAYIGDLNSTVELGKRSE